ncbi:zinc finger BED domain-containing protein RICESLEEPER 2-like [Ipomoea triloba]|uniref:zinc finger BED domain-containing protein RICESLEEPER 2-like n=1 Tax=Ipomoea triloba TaxID=35885 RepID=UPI00125D8BBC|nr:zinc finger BED domain-containing protein RICESLEEPER 2-like [Ipomoea triloba]
MNFDCDGTIRSKNLDIGLAREVFAAAIVEHDCPFAFAEYLGFRKYHKLLNPDALIISRNTLVSYINKLYLKEKYKFKQVLTSIPNRICLTSDLWTACTTEGYICLTGHFVDEKWKLNSKILAFDKMPPPHTVFELAQKIYEILKDWGIEKSLLCNGEFFHIRCSTHILNLIVQEDLKAATHTLHRIRESTKYAKSTESGIKKFQECVVEVGSIDTSIGLRLDMPICWNSTYLMFDSATRYKKVFSLLQLKDKNFKVYPSNEEWKRGERLCAFFKPFYEMTNLISSSSYPTSNVYFLQVWKIERLLKDGLSDEDTLMSAMCKRMLGKFDKYWSEYSVVLAFGVVLDPRFKFKVLEKLLRLRQILLNAKQILSCLEKKLYRLYDQYVSVTGSSSSQPSSSTIMHSRVESQVVNKYPTRFFNDILDVSDEIVAPVEKSELDHYSEQPCYEMKFY